MDKKRNIKLLIIGSILLIMIVLGGVYAWLTYTTGNVIVAGNTHCFNINYTKGADITGNIGAIKEEDYVTSNTIKLSTAMGFTPISMELDKRCNKVSGIGVLELNVQSLSTAFTSNGNSYGSLKYVVAEYDPKLYKDSTIQYLKNQTFTYIRRGIISEEGTMDIHTEYLSPGDKHNYLIIIYLDKNKVGDDIIGANITATGTARADQFVATPLSDFTYYTGTYNGIQLPEGAILLTRYNGTDGVVNVASSYALNDTTYTTIIYADTDSDTSTFSGNTNITNVNFADGVLFYEYDGTNLIANSINSLFKGCTSIISAPKLPSTITSMNSTYEGCTSLTNIEYVPASTTSMLGTFKNCTNLEGYIRIPNENVVVDSNTFSGTTNTIILEVPSRSDTYDNITAVAPNNVEVETIGTAKTPITDFLYVIGTGEKITSIPIYAYSDCINNTNNPTYEEKETYNYTLNSPIILASNEVLLTGYNGNSTDIHIPDTYTIHGITYNVVMLSYMPIEFAPREEAGAAVSAGNFGNYSYGAMFLAGVKCPTIMLHFPDKCHDYGLLMDNSLVQTININESVTALGIDPDIDDNIHNNIFSKAFWNDTSLTRVDSIPSSIVTMNATYEGCTSLVEVPNIPNTVLNLNGTFLGCTSLVTAPIIGSSVIEMQNTFWDCTNLENTVVINSNSVANTQFCWNQLHPFYNTTKNITVDVPESSDTYTNLTSEKPENITITTH